MIRLKSLAVMLYIGHDVDKNVLQTTAQIRNINCKLCQQNTSLFNRENWFKWKFGSWVESKVACFVFS